MGELLNDQAACEGWIAESGRPFLRPCPPTRRENCLRFTERGTATLHMASGCTLDHGRPVYIVDSFIPIHVQGA